LGGNPLSLYFIVKLFGNLNYLAYLCQMKEIFIPGSVPSSKNSKVWTGRYLVWSKSAQKYKKDTKDYWIKYKDLFISGSTSTKPIRVSFTFVRGSKHKFDYVNPLQTILDLMVEYKWIEDDNADEIIPVFGKYKYDKEKPGIYIRIL
jgi:hypothetical protein